MGQVLARLLLDPCGKRDKRHVVVLLVGSGVMTAGKKVENVRFRYGN